jgi:hypothetical protein
MQAPSRPLLIDFVVDIEAILNRRGCTWCWRASTIVWWPHHYCRNGWEYHTHWQKQFGQPIHLQECKEQKLMLEIMDDWAARTRGRKADRSLQGHLLAYIRPCAWSNAVIAGLLQDPLAIVEWPSNLLLWFIVVALPVDFIPLLQIAPSWLFLTTFCNNQQSSSGFSSTYLPIMSLHPPCTSTQRDAGRMVLIQSDWRVIIWCPCYWGSFHFHISTFAHPTQLLSRQIQLYARWTPQQTPSHILSLEPSRPSQISQNNVGHVWQAIINVAGRVLCLWD